MGRMLVGSIMSRQSPMIQLGMPVADVVEVLLRQRFLGLPVVDANKVVVGFVSEQDCLKSLLVSGYHDEGSPKVEDVMHKEPLTLTEDTAIVDVAQMMLAQKPKIYPVVDENKKLLGILVRNQVLIALRDRRAG
ncbi:MAG TPA: CBS domain-containing protein [Alcanivoracaceae bacterium]|nr:CBS domain-containing protein [Alcanivoracaceae bacterium]